MFIHHNPEHNALKMYTVLQYWHAAPFWELWSSQPLGLSKVCMLALGHVKPLGQHTQLSGVKGDSGGKGDRRRSILLNALNKEVWIADVSVQSPGQKCPTLSKTCYLWVSVGQVCSQNQMVICIVGDHKNTKSLTSLMNSTSLMINLNLSAKKSSLKRYTYGGTIG